MATPLLLKRSSVSGKTPTTDSLQLGELALNTYDGRAFFKYNQGSDVLREIVTLDGTQTLSNKTLTSPTINSASGSGNTENNLTLTGTLTANGSTGSNGQVLTATGTGVKWAAAAGSSLASLSDVYLLNPQSAQVLTYNGAQWVNAAVGGTIASAVFAAGASSDLGLVTDLTVTHSEDLGLITDTPPSLYYDLSILQVQGVVALSNLDSSVRTDYISYSIIFGF